MNLEEQEKRLYLLNVVGKGVAALIEDLDELNEKFLKNKSDKVQFGNTIYFSSEKNVQELSEELSNIMGEEFAYVILDITENLNIYDFNGHITNEHKFAKEFVELIKSFTVKKEPELSLEEQLELAVEVEDYKTAAEIRDKINSKK